MQKGKKRGRWEMVINSLIHNKPKMEKVKKTPKEAMMNVVEEREMAKSSQNMENMQFMGRTPNF
jgi:hypothetical protein